MSSYLAEGTAMLVFNVFLINLTKLFFPADVLNSLEVTTTSIETPSGIVYVVSLYCPNQLFDSNDLSIIESYYVDKSRSIEKIVAFWWLNSYINNTGGKLHRWLITYTAARNISHFIPTFPTNNVRNSCL